MTPQAVEWSSKGDYEDYEKDATTLQQLADRVLKGKTLSKPALIFFHQPADPSGKGLDPLAVLTSGKDLSLGMALHNVFDVYTVAVPKTTVLAGKSSPLTLVTDAKGQLLADTGGKGPITASSLYSAMSAASKILGYDLKAKVTRACSLVQTMISLEGQVKTQRENLAKIANPNQRGVTESRIADLEKRRIDLEAQEKAIWADLPTIKPESATKAG